MFWIGEPPLCPPPGELLSPVDPPSPTLETPQVTVAPHSSESKNVSLLPLVAIARVPGALWVTTFWSFAHQQAWAGESMCLFP